MPDDHSPGDGRKPYSDTGGPEARHAQTHDVAREKDHFAEDLAEQTPQRVHQQHLEADSGADDKKVGKMLPELREDQLSRLSILEPGTPLEQGSVYLNLDDRGSGPFKAIGGQEVGAKQKIVAKSMTDYELWNEIAGRDDEADIVRPEQEGHHA